MNYIFIGYNSTNSTTLKNFQQGKPRFIYNDFKKFTLFVGYCCTVLRTVRMNHLLPSLKLQCYCLFTEMQGSQLFVSQ
jgi:hypothetical protein